MRKLLTSVSAVAIAGFAAYGIVQAANISLFTSPSVSDPAAVLASLNALVQAVNSGVTGQFAFTPGPIGNTGSGSTTQNITFASATVPTGTLIAAGQGFRARCAGTSNIATSAKFGITVGRSMAVSLETALGEATNAPNWDLEIQWQAATNPVTANYVWMSRALAGTASGGSSGQVSTLSGNDTTVTDNNANFAVPVTCVLYNGVATGEVTMQNFEVEVIR